MAHKNPLKPIQDEILTIDNHSKIPTHSDGGAFSEVDTWETETSSKLGKIIDKIGKILDEPDKLKNATVPQLGTLLGISIDKKRLLDGKSTMTVAHSHSAVINQIHYLQTQIARNLQSLPELSRKKIVDIIPSELVDNGEQVVRKPGRPRKVKS